MGDDGEIVGDEQIRETVLALQVDQQIDHLRLDRDVERRYRLVAHDQARPERQRACDADALPLSAGELMRIVLHLVGPQAHLREQFGNAFLLRATGCKPVHAERFADDIARGHARIERGERVLEHDLHRAPMRPHLGLAQTGDVGAVELDGARGRLHQPQHAARDRRFAAAGFADQPERLALADRKADAVDRMHGADAPTQDAAAHRVMLDEVGDLKQRALIGHGAPTNSAARQHAAK